MGATSAVSSVQGAGLHVYGDSSPTTAQNHSATCEMVEKVARILEPTLDGNGDHVFLKVTRQDEATLKAAFTCCICRGMIINTPGGHSNMEVTGMCGRDSESRGLSVRGKVKKKGGLSVREQKIGRQWVRMIKIGTERGGHSVKAFFYETFGIQWERFWQFGHSVREFLKIWAFSERIFPKNGDLSVRTKYFWKLGQSVRAILF